MSETEARLSIINGSKSFSLAARFFPNEHWRAAYQLYHWCRYCDDVVDQENSSDDFNNLLLETDQIWHGTPASAPFQSMQTVVKSYDIPSLYSAEMLQGMKMDLDHKKYHSFDELKLYCYRVASTVGLMMCHVMGIFHIRALKNAAYLGMAMQMTNIARDVKEDQSIGRLYLPEAWLKQSGLSREDFFEPQNRHQLFQIVKKLISRSEIFYRKGLNGLRDLPLRSAFVILLAANFYREIGRQIKSAGPMALDERMVVTGLRKFYLVVKSILQILLSIPRRLFDRRKIVPINETWRLF